MKRTVIPNCMSNDEWSTKLSLYNPTEEEIIVEGTATDSEGKDLSINREVKIKPFGVRAIDLNIFNNQGGPYTVTVDSPVSALISAMLIHTAKAKTNIVGKESKLIGSFNQRVESMINLPCYIEFGEACIGDFMEIPNLEISGLDLDSTSADPINPELRS